MFAPDVFLNVDLVEAKEDVNCAGAIFQVIRPGDTNRLLEVAAEHLQFEKSRYVPYWANIWPVSRYLASYLLTMDWADGPEQVLELGCGLGLAGLAALKCGHHVTFSDYDLAALRYATRNAEENGFTNFSTMPLNWQYPRAEKFSLMIGSDLTFMPKLVPHLVNVFSEMLAPGGRIILADQNRIQPQQFVELLAAKGFTTQFLSFPVPEEWAWKATGSLYQIQRTC